MKTAKGSLFEGLVTFRIPIALSDPFLVDIFSVLGWIIVYYSALRKLVLLVTDHHYCCAVMLNFKDNRFGSLFWLPRVPISNLAGHKKVLDSMQLHALHLTLLWLNFKGTVSPLLPLPVCESGYDESLERWPHTSLSMDSPSFSSYLKIHGAADQEKNWGKVWCCFQRIGLGENLSKQFTCAQSAFQQNAMLS